MVSLSPRPCGAVGAVRAGWSVISKLCRGMGVLHEHKKALRQTVARRIKAVSTEEISRQSRVVAEKLFLLDGYRNATKLGLFLSMPSEIRTDSILRRALADGKRVYSPRVVDSERMELFEIRIVEEVARFARSRWQIPEPPDEPERLVSPSALDLMVLPGVAYDHRCRRLGHGRGYYDRYISRCREDLVKVGIGLTEQVVAEVPVGPTDQPLDLVLVACGPEQQRPSPLQTDQEQIAAPLSPDSPHKGGA